MVNQIYLVLYHSGFRADTLNLTFTDTRYARSWFMDEHGIYQTVPTGIQCKVQ